MTSKTDTKNLDTREFPKDEPSHDSNRRNGIAFDAFRVVTPSPRPNVNGDFIAIIELSDEHA